MNPIGWCDITRNYVRGCLTRCKFCYAIRFNARTWLKMFHIEARYRLENNIYDLPIQSKNKHDETLYTRMRDFKPVFMYSQFAKPLPKKPMRIFMDSMSDVAYWKPEWIEKVLDKIREYPQYKFLFLTKKPEIYQKYHFNNRNTWLGITITKGIDIVKLNRIAKETPYHYFSIEPILENIEILDDILYLPTWFIVGADSSNSKNKIIPKKEWIEEIKLFCQDNNISYFEKDNLKNILNRELIQEFPEKIK